MKTNTTKTARIEAALSFAGIHKFQSRSSYPESDAPQNLMGRTHYADPDTLKYFKARILNARPAADGLLYWIVESLEGKRRAVVFDVFGTVVNERPSLDAPEQWHRTTDQATAAALAFVATFDAAKHTSDTLKARARRDMANAKQTLAALAGRATA